MRGPDKKALVVAFGDIIGSRQLEINSSFSLRLSFDEAPEESHWTIGKSVREIHNLEDGVLILGISTPYSIITMSTLLPERGFVSLPFKRTESLHLFARKSTSLEFSFIRDHTELTVYDYGRPPSSSSLPCALPLFDALRVLDMICDNPSFLAGHTFHELERCRLLKEDPFKHSPSERMMTETGMPVCTRVDIDDPWVLASFRLPQIHELALNCSNPNCSLIWEKHIAVNANLSGLNLLHLKDWRYNGDLIPILRSVPSLETLIINTYGSVNSFRAFLPMDAYETPGLEQTTGEEKPVLCPKLQHLQIENGGLLMQPDLIRLAESIITLRAKCKSPLRGFTFSEFWCGSNFELIGRDGGFTMEMSLLAQGAKKFKLDI